MTDSRGPLKPFADGRDARGRFAKGNRGGPGNPYSQKVAKFRSALLAAVNLRDVREVVRAILAEAKGGDVQAARLLFDRLLGPAEAIDMIAKLDEIEERIGINQTNE